MRPPTQDWLDEAGSHCLPRDAENLEDLLKLAETHIAENLKSIMKGKASVIERSVLLSVHCRAIRGVRRRDPEARSGRERQGFINKEKALIEAISKAGFDRIRGREPQGY